MESRFKSLGFILATIAFLTLLGVVAVRLFPVSAPTDSPALCVPGEQLYVGTVVAQSGYKHVLTIHNTSGNRVKINRFISSCTCADTVPEHVEIAPGESCDIELTLELTRFLKLDRSRVIPATIRITPVVDSVVSRPWTLEVDVVRPLIYLLEEEVDFGLISPDVKYVDSVETVFVSDEVEPANVATNTPCVTGAELIRVADDQAETCPEGYGEYRFRLSLAYDGQPYGAISSSLSVYGLSDAAQLSLPCRLRFDSGLRVVVEQMPSRIVEPGQPIEWIASVFGAEAPVCSAGIRGAAESERYSIEVLQEGVEDGVWRFRCTMLPKIEGDIVINLAASAELDDGSKDSRVLPLRFFALRSPAKTGE